MRMSCLQERGYRHQSLLPSASKSCPSPRCAGAAVATKGEDARSFTAVACTRKRVLSGCALYTLDISSARRAGCCGKVRCMSSAIEHKRALAGRARTPC
eukprot:CAMPEP_0185171830 /NCGR_PEP_ID=MMETSP1139-20130426/20677_1 /TAXON_ID=298111 /ORGANISM="Pavlova sp., Strain CCMP459" /LENGTH=98 /DNA_ID=CAMNT_0027737451 /DNA_START=283 /DNA_END=576 /DNA_ORIENTATION=+